VGCPDGHPAFLPQQEQPSSQQGRADEEDVGLLGGVEHAERGTGACRPGPMAAAAIARPQHQGQEAEKNEEGLLDIVPAEKNLHGREGNPQPGG